MPGWLDWSSVQLSNVSTYSTPQLWRRLPFQSLCVDVLTERVLEKKATGRSAYLNVAAITQTVASVSTTNGTDGFIVVITGSAISNLSFSKASTAQQDKEKVFTGVNRRIFSKRGVIHCEQWVNLPIVRRRAHMLFGTGNSSKGFSRCGSGAIEPLLTV